MKKTVETILLAMIIITGLSLFLYPTVSNLISERNSSKTIAGYDQSVGTIAEESGARELLRAEEYNEALFLSAGSATPDEVSLSDYGDMLNVTADGMMGYIEIPAIGCRLPVYHGTDASTLESYIGHLPSSSLPVGGESTHCVLTGHTGMPSARLLTDLDKLEVGDRFRLTTLDRKMVYEVDRILVVQPDEIQALQIEQGKDYCTLVTCTPYGINTHRLLVRGRRVYDTEWEQPVANHSLADIFINDPVMLALAGLLIAMMTAFAVTRLKRD